MLPLPCFSYLGPTSKILPSPSTAVILCIWRGIQDSRSSPVYQLLAKLPVHRSLWRHSRPEPQPSSFTPDFNLLRWSICKGWCSSYSVITSDKHPDTWSEKTMLKPETCISACLVNPRQECSRQRERKVQNHQVWSEAGVFEKQKGGQCSWSISLWGSTVLDGLRGAVRALAWSVGHVVCC